MATLQYVGIDTSLYTSQTAVPPDSLDSDDNRSPEDRLFNDCDNDEPLYSLMMCGCNNDSEPLLFFYDCETQGSYGSRSGSYVVCTRWLTHHQHTVFQCQHLATLKKGNKYLRTNAPFLLPVSKSV